MAFVKRLVTASAALALATCMLVAAAAAGPSRDDALSALAAVARGAAPKEPLLCRGPTTKEGVDREGTVEYRDALCGSRSRDRFRTRGGGDAVWAYHGNDVIASRDLKPDEVWGGPGRDTADTDPCDSVHGVEERTKGRACPGVSASQGKFQATDELPYYPPVVECWTEADASGVMNFLWEPEVRALDVTKEVDFQTVAWQALLLKEVAGEWQLSHEGTWFWDRTYDMQVEAFTGNFWRSFGTGDRTYVHYRVYEPGTYALAVRLHWYKTASAPEQETDVLARAHYGPNEQAGHGACEFPA